MALTGSDITLRDTTHSPYTNKSGELTYSEQDVNTYKMADAILALQDAAGLAAYDVSTTYSSGDYVRYDTKVWRYINGTPSAGNTPEEGAYWTLATPGELSHQRNKDTKLDEGGANEVTAAGLKAVSDTGLKYKKLSLTSGQFTGLPATPIEILPAPGAGKVTVPIMVFARIFFGTTAYSVGTVIAIKHDTGTADLFTTDSLAESSANRNIYFEQVTPVSPDATSSQMIANKALQIYSPSAPITSGDSTMDLFVIYAEITT